MNKILFIVIIVIMAIAVIAVNLLINENNYVSVVENLDIVQYSGIWYSVYEIPTYYGIFPFGYMSTECSGSMADYYSWDNITLSVTNSCLRNGKTEIVKGTARFVIPDTGRLEVSFFSYIWSEYNVIGLDEDYQWAVVCSSDLDHLWYLSRNTYLGDYELVIMGNIARSQGFDIQD